MGDDDETLEEVLGATVVPEEPTSRGRRRIWRVVPILLFGFALAAALIIPEGGDTRDLRAATAETGPAARESASPPPPTTESIHEPTTNADSAATTTSEPATVPASLLGQLVFTSDRSDIESRHTALWVMNHDGSSPRQLTEAPDGDFGNVFGADLSPDGRQVVFVRQIGGQSLQIERMNVDTGNIVILTPPGIYLNPRWSPDGSRILYVPGTYGVSGHELFTMRPDGSDKQKVFSGGADIPLRSASWSPDGRRVVVDTDESNPDAKGLWVIDLSNSSSKRLFAEEPGPGPFPENSVMSPAWSPKGDRIVFTKGSHLFTINPDGSGLRQVTTGPLLGDGGSLNVNPAWFPDGSRIAFVRSQAPELNYDIASVSADGSDLRNLTHAVSDDQGPTF